MVGGTPGSEERAVIVTGANTYNMTTLPTTKLVELGYFSSNNIIYNSFLYGEVALPGVTGIQTAATVDIDYPLNIALPNNWCLVAGLGTAANAANGWVVSAFGGKY
jgi:hypothetical protein